MFRTLIFNNVAPGSSFLIEVVKYCKDCLTSCKTVHDEILQNQDRDEIRGRYFRFNTPGMGNIPLEEWKKILDMIALTQTYMESPSVRDLKLKAAKLLMSWSVPGLNCMATQAADNSESEVGPSRALEQATVSSSVNALPEHLSLGTVDSSRSVVM
jgi:hypothetical protein